MSKNLQRIFSFIVVVGMMAGFLQPLRTAQAAAALNTLGEEQTLTTTSPKETLPQANSSAKAQPLTDRELKALLSDKKPDPMEKLSADLRELAANAAEKSINGPELGAPASQPVIVAITVNIRDERTLAKEGKLFDQLQPYFVDGKLFETPVLPKFTMQSLYGLILPRELSKVAGYDDVLQITSVTLRKADSLTPVPADDTQPPLVAPDPAVLKANAENLRAGSKPWSEAKAFGDGRVSPDTRDWYEMSVSGPAKAEVAWERGFTGKGVTVAVLDDGVDFAHPDLMGTQKIYSSTWATAYNGYVMTIDPLGMELYFVDEMFGTSFTDDAYSGSTLMDTSTTPDTTPCGVGLSCFKYAPLGTVEHTYIIDSSWSKSGIIHVGTHHDASMKDYLWGEKVALLVVDPHVAGVYDTVYVDLDDDYDFTNEKPATKADVNDLDNTKNKPISYRDLTGDGLADIYGGALYFIADGVNCPPGMDYLYGCGAPVNRIRAPGNGNLVGLHGPWDSGSSHGTHCASNVVGQGVVNGLLPSFRDLPGDGKPAGAVFGAAPEASLVAGNVYSSLLGNSFVTAYNLSAFGYDGIDQNGCHFLYGCWDFEDTDAILATSNSYGWSATYNDGWDYEGQAIAQLQRYNAPYLQFLFSTGNGGSGYGTAAPPSPALGIQVGASTEFGSTGWDTITDTTQITYNDLVYFSNAGPSERDGAGVDVLAGGAYAAGDEELNYSIAWNLNAFGSLDANLAWASWGGTSRSAPVALGVLALVYDAYRQAHGVWPTADVAKAILMSGAIDINNGVFRQGAGAVNADTSTAIASGMYGVHMAGNSVDWTPGDYRGVDYPGFAHITYPGDTYSKTFEIVNPAATTTTLTLSDARLTLIDSQTFTYTVTPAMIAEEYKNGTANRDNFYKAFNFFIPITATNTADPAMQSINIPAGTDLMVVRQIQPYNEFDVDGLPYGSSNTLYDNRFYLTVYNWTDINGDGKVWEDKDVNGVVNFINAPPPNTLIDAGVELAWDDPLTELQRWEYERYQYSRPTGNTYEVSVQNPLERMNDGMFIGLRHMSTPAGRAVTSHLQYRIEFYQKADVPWLNVDQTEIEVLPNSSAEFSASVTVPDDMPAGSYEAAIQALEPGSETYGENLIIVPVTLHVAKEFDGASTVTFGGAESAQYDANQQYNNAVVRGFFEWGWREESGDWRAFFTDINNWAGTLLSESFEAPLDGWSVVDWAEAGLVWDTCSNWGDDNYAGSGDCYEASSDKFGESAYDTELWTPPFDLPTEDSVLQFTINYQNYGDDFFEVSISTDGGENWDILGDWVDDLGKQGSQPGTVITIPLDDYTGMTGLILGFRYANFDPAAWDWYVQIDDIQINRLKMPLDTQVIVKNEWADAAPHTDIDTVVLGPTATSLSAVRTGMWNIAMDEPGYFGAYTLNTVAQSVVDRAGRAQWRFNTTSGGNEEWITFPLENSGDAYGGLYEMLQHNVVFEGDQFGVVFTQTLGALNTSSDFLMRSTYVDQGWLGDVVVQSGLDLNGLVADGYLESPSTIYYDEALLDTPASFDWTREVTLTSATKLLLVSDSPDISDIDLFLFYWTGSAWKQVASSTSSSAHEEIDLANPPDGKYQIAIDNYSGPDGTLRLTQQVFNRVNALTVSAPAGPVQAGQPVTVTVGYDYPLAPGDYLGKVFVGPPEAPQLKEVTVYLMRLAPSVVRKNVDSTTHLAGDKAQYWIDLYNVEDPDGLFTLTDVIPADMEYVTATVEVGGETTPLAYDSLSNSVTFSGVLPLSQQRSEIEGFEGGEMPPAGWKLVSTNVDATWLIADVTDAKLARYVHDGMFGAYLPWNYAQDEWLISPVLGPVYSDLSFWSNGDLAWCQATDNCDLNVWLIVGEVGGGDDVLLGQPDEQDWTESWAWAESIYGLPNPVPAGDLRIGFEYVGSDAASIGLDDILLPDLLPAATVMLTTAITDTLADGVLITNTATLEVVHFVGAAWEETESLQSAAVIRTALADFKASYKEAPEVVLPGEQFTYTIHVINSSEIVTYTATLVDPLPAGAIYVDSAGGLTYNAAKDQVEWSGEVTPGSDMVFTVVAMADEILEDGEVIENVATLTVGGEAVELPAQTLVVTMPIADFTAPDLALAGETVDFTNRSTGTAPLTYAWDFGDGASSTDENPGHAFAAVGSYVVTLTVTNNYGENSFSSAIAIGEAPVAGFTAPTAAATGEDVSFVNTSTGTAPLTYAWDFGDGASSTDENPVHSFAEAGDYTVTLTTTNDYGEDSFSSAIAIGEAPIAGFTAPTVAATGEEVAFSNTSTGTAPLTYAWDFGDGATSTVENPSHAFAAAGSYTVTLTVASDYGEDGFSSAITVGDAPMAGFTAPTAAATGKDVSFVNTSTGTAPLTYAWDFGDGASSTDENPVHSFAEAGTYTVTLTTTSDYGEDSFSSAITVGDAPVAGFTAPTTAATGEEVAFVNTSTGTAPLAYAWDFGDGASSMVENPSHAFATVGSHVVTLTVTSDYGKDSFSSAITVGDAPVAGFTASTTAAVGEEVAFNNTSSGTDPLAYAWDFGDGASSADENPVHSFAEAGTYTVTLTTTNGYGEDSFSSAITIGETPTAGFTAPAAAAVGKEVAFVNTSAGTAPLAYAWDFGNGATSTVENPGHAFASVGSYTVTLTVTSDYGEDSFSSEITIGEAPVAGFSVSEPVVAGTEVNFTAQSTGTEALSYKWDFGDDDSSLAKDPVHTFGKAGVYTVTLEVSSPFGKDTASKLVTVYDPTAADFNVQATALVNEEVVFTNQSSGGFTTCSWNFGDETTSNTCANPVHAYAAPGEYTVELTVSGPGGTNSAAKTITVNNTSAETPTSLVFTDDQQNQTVVDIPAGAVTTPITLDYTPVPTVTAPGGFVFGGRAFELNASQNGTPLEGFTFNVPVTLTIHYSDADVAGLDELSLILRYLTPAVAWEDAACGAYERHPEENWFSVPICHLSKFATFGTPSLPPVYKIFLPTIQR